MKRGGRQGFAASATEPMAALTASWERVTEERGEYMSFGQCGRRSTKLCRHMMLMQSIADKLHGFVASPAARGLCLSTATRSADDRLPSTRLLAMEMRSAPPW